MKTLFTSLLLLLCVCCVTAQTPHCCIDSIIINTGYNPVTGFAVPTDTTDPYWVIDSAGAAIPGAGSAGSPAYTIPSIPPSSGPWITNPSTDPGQWISATDTNSYPTYGTGSTDEYIFTLGRPFRTCTNDSIKFSLNIAVDDYLLNIIVDSNDTLAFSETTPGIGYWENYNYYTQTIYLTAGNHSLNIISLNANTFNPTNGMGLNIYGSISSKSGLGSVVNESDTGCKNYVPTGLSQLQLANTHHAAIRVLPNPSNGQAKIYYTLPTGVNDGIINIYNTIGQAVMVHHVTNTTSYIVIDNTDLPAGMYFYRLSGAGFTPIENKMLIVK